MLLAVPAVALADIVSNNVVEIEGNKTKYVKPGVSTTVGYFIQVEGQGVDGQAGCNAADGSAATVTLNVPPNVTTNDADNKLTFSQCNAGNSQSVNFSSNTEGTYNITASVSDTGTGSYTNQANWTLVVDGTAPGVDSTVPANNATGVAVANDITATFNEKVDPLTISGSTFTLTGPSGSVPATVTYDALTKTAKLNPTSDLAQNTTYTATLEGGATGSVVKDYAGNALASDYSWSFKTFNPNTAPELTVPPNITGVEATGPNGAPVNFTVSASDTEDGSLTPSCTRGTPPAPVTSGATFALGTTTVNCSVTDSGGLSDSGSFTVTVVDTAGPVLDLPDDITDVEATGPNGAPVNFTASADDLVDGSRSVTCTRGTPPAAVSSGATFALGTTTVNCSASDTRNNSSEGSFTVEVVDTTAPDLTLPDNITKEATSASGATATFTTSATDLVDGSVSVNCTKGTPPVAVSSGDTFPVGTTTVNCSATDAAGNTANGNFTVTVSYGWSGFLQPINTLANMPTNYKQSIFKIGSTVPVKFQLTGASAGIPDGNFYLKVHLYG